jgi:sec-independent protein translocase protein TatA
MDPVTAWAVDGEKTDVRPGCDSAGVELEVVMIGKLGLPEILIILAIALLIFGPGRLSELGKGLGEGIRNFKSAVKDGETPAEKK